MKKQLEIILGEIVKELTNDPIKIDINIPKDINHGDYATNLAFILAKKLDKNPKEIAEMVIEKFKTKASLKEIERIEFLGGFINFWVSKNQLLKITEEFVKNPDSAGKSEKNKGKKVVVEYSSPNIAKPFTIGHLRSTIIGDAISNLLEAVGYQVFRDNHLGDWGSQFGKQIYAIKNIPLEEYPSDADIEKLNEEVLESSKNPIKDLVSLYIKFHEEAEKNPELEEKGRMWFKKLEDGDPEARKLWQKCIDWSFKEFDRIYKELNVPSAQGKSFENNGRGYGESYFEDKMKPVLEELQEKRFLIEGKEGAKIVNFPDTINLPPLMILKKDGATLYATRDLATDKFRLEKYGSDVLVINEVGAEQSLYFKQLYLLEEMLGWYQKGQRIHVGHGMYRFKDAKMSTRKGNVIWLEDVLQEARTRAYQLAATSGEQRGGWTSDAASMSVGEVFQQGISKTNNLVSKEKQEEVKQIAIGALKWNDLKRNSNLDVIFDWDQILNMQGNSGPYLQYTYTRTQSVLNKSKIINNVIPDPLRLSKASQIRNPDIDSHFHGNDNRDLIETEELMLLRKLYHFSESVENAASALSPNIICEYLFDLAQGFNLFYQKKRILNAENPSERELRLLITAASGIVLKQGLGFLGIVAPKKM